jgi:hypothetical protein
LGAGAIQIIAVEELIYNPKFKKSFQKKIIIYLIKLTINLTLNLKREILAKHDIYSLRIRR